MADDATQEAEEMKKAIEAGTYATEGDGPDDVAPVKEDK
jgi:hypothetical protein